MSFPVHRGRRLRRTPALRALARETHFAPDQLVAPLFVCPGSGVREPIPSMPGQARLSPDLAARETASLAELGIGSVLLFGIPAVKDAGGTGAWDPYGPVPQAIRRIKRDVPAVAVWADVCLCQYATHGHCGVPHGGDVDNDGTLPLLARVSRVYAEGGADVIAPSDMMDGRIGVIRAALDSAGLTNTAIVSHAAKYASAFYAPFGDAAGSIPPSADRRGYQMDTANVREAVGEAMADIEEGADMVMVTPGLPCLDVIRAVRSRVHVPVVAYQVSGEFAMLHAAAERGWIDLPRAMQEAAVALRRAGADVLITYFARELAMQVAAARPAVAAVEPVR